MNRTVLLASSALVSMFVAQGALAAEWTGFYIGANVGGAFGDVDLTGVSEDTDYVNITPGEVFSFSPDGVIGGAQLGYNYQFGDWLFGVEVEGHGMDFDEFASDPASTDILSVESEWGATATARLGFVLGANSLLYVKGGYATGNIKTSYLDTDGPTTQTGLLETDETHHGFVIGGGFEHAIGEHTSVGVEYNYIDLGETDHSGIASGTGGGLVVNNVEAQLHTVTARLNYHFNPF